jgi:hypothetical protein
VNETPRDETDPLCASCEHRKSLHTFRGQMCEANRCWCNKFWTRDELDEDNRRFPLPAL